MAGADAAYRASPNNENHMKIIFRTNESGIKYVVEIGVQEVVPVEFHFNE
jgi:hypothetical protein